MRLQFCASAFSYQAIYILIISWKRRLFHSPQKNEQTNENPIFFESDIVMTAFSLRPLRRCRPIVRATYVTTWFKKVHLRQRFAGTQLYWLCRDYVRTGGSTENKSRKGNSDGQSKCSICEIRFLNPIFNDLRGRYARMTTEPAPRDGSERRSLCHLVEYRYWFRTSWNTKEDQFVDIYFLLDKSAVIIDSVTP